jgi:hypothetical protein
MNLLEQLETEIDHQIELDLVGFFEGYDVLELGIELSESLVNGVPKEIFLVLEVGVHRSGSDTGGICYRLDGGALVPSLSEGIKSGLKNVVPLLVIQLPRHFSPFIE